MALVKCPMCGDGSAHVRGCLVAELTAQPISGADAQRQAALQQALFEGEQFVGRLGSNRDAFAAGVKARLLFLGLQARGVRPDDFVTVEHKRAVADVFGRLEDEWRRARPTEDGPSADRLIETLRSLEGLRVESAHLALAPPAPAPAEEKRMLSNIMRRDIALVVFVLGLPSVVVVLSFRDFGPLHVVLALTVLFPLVLAAVLNQSAQNTWLARNAGAAAQVRAGELKVMLEDLVLAPDGQKMVELFDRHPELRTAR